MELELQKKGQEYKNCNCPLLLIHHSTLRDSKGEETTQSSPESSSQHVGPTVPGVGLIDDTTSGAPQAFIAGTHFGSLIWHNSDGQNKTILQHLLRHHQKAWTNTVVLKKLKGWEEVVRKADPNMRSKIPKERLPFTIEGFCEHLEHWVAVDDQSIAVVECPEFWDLLWYTGTELKESDIPHCTKLLELIDKYFKSEYNKVIDEIQILTLLIAFDRIPGRLAITGDIWSVKIMYTGKPCQGPIGN
ncbi:hypothetical protein EV368DRAFT_63595 [Lentinula lateritia]|nr:hypothetical protein EV368DRAFT_63595 [Lentinula lateritia]